MRHPRKVEKQNKGFSLVEVLVTLAVISILSIPIIQTFLNSARTNKQARRIQNATDIAQSVSEYFDAMSMDRLKTTYSGKYKTLSENKVVFNNIGDGTHIDNNGIAYYEGADGGAYYVSVVMDPTSYTEGDGILGNANSYVKPGINNLSEQSSITCFGKLNQYDRKVFEGADKSKIVKKSVFRIYEKESTTYKNKVEYRYYLDIYYTASEATGSYSRGQTVSYENIELGIGTLDKAAISAPNLYIIYNPFFAMYGTSPYSNDTIEIKYMTDETGEKEFEKSVNVYLVQQEAHFGNNTDNVISLKKENISITCYKGIDSITSTAGSFDNEKANKLNFYTNVKGWPDNATLTTGNADDNKWSKLYTVSVYVWKDKADGITYDEEGKLIIDDSSALAYVDNVKED